MIDILDRISEIFRGTKAPSLSHPVFGEISLIRGKKGQFWMHDAYEDGELTISIETRSSEEPSEAQVSFFKELTSDWNATFARASGQLIPRYEAFMKKSFPANWRSAFVPAGLNIPIDGATDEPWDVTFECTTDSCGFLFTCYFEKGQPIGVTVDT